MDKEFNKNFDEFLSLAEASNITGYHQDYLGFLCRNGKLQGFKIGRNWTTTKQALEDFEKTYKNGISEITDETGNKIQVKVIKPVVPTKVNSETANEIQGLISLPGPLSESSPVLFTSQPLENLSHLKKEVLVDIDSKVKNLVDTVSKIQNETQAQAKVLLESKHELAEWEEKIKAESKKQHNELELLAVAPIKTDLSNNFSSNFSFEGSASSGNGTEAGENLNSEKLYSSFSAKPKINMARLAAYGITSLAIAAFAGMIFWSGLYGFLSGKQNSDLTILYQGQKSESLYSLPASTSPTTVVYVTNASSTVVNKTVNQLLGFSDQQIYNLIDNRLNQYLAEGKFKGETGPQGLQGLPGTSGTQGGYNPFAVYQPNQSSGYSGGTGLSSNQFSADSAVIGNLTASGLAVSGNSSFTGNTSITNLTVGSLNTGLAQGSVVFQGASGLTQDNNNFFYNSTTSQLSLGTSTPNLSALLELDSTSKGFLAPRMTQAQRDAIVSPANGLMIYNTDFNAYNVYNGTAWGAIGSGGSGSGVVNAGQAGFFAYYPSNTSTVSSQSVLYTTSSVISIATTSPSATLFVAGNSSSLPSLLVQGTSGQSAAIFSIASSSSSSLFVVNPNGNIGIGTTTPTSKLTVQGSGIGNILAGEWGGNSAYAGFSFNGSLDTGHYNIIGSPSDSNLYINRPNGGDIKIGENNNQSQLVIKTGGNIGIGTSTPAQLLSIAGNMQLTGALFDSSNASGTLGMVLQTTGTGTRWVATSTLGITSASASGTPGNIQFAGTAGAFNATNLFNWDNTNLKLSIGTTSTSSTLTLQGLGGSSPLLTISSSSGSSLLTVLANGRVGIGTANPAQLLSVNGNASVVGIVYPTGQTSFTIGSSESASTINIFPGINNRGGEINLAGGVSAVNPGTIIFRSGTGSGQQSEVARFDANGNFGIGTSTTASRLSLTGSPTIDPFDISSTSGVSLLRFTQEGRLGIGTSGPISNLTVVGASAVSTSTIFTVSTSTSGQLFSVLANGNIGIGTANPVVALDVVGKGKFSSGLTTNSTLPSGDMVMTSRVYTNSFFGLANGNIAFSNVSGIEKARFDTINGNLYIATTSPLATLVAVGNSSTIPTLFIQGTSTQTTVLTVQNSLGNSLVAVLNNGNIGIGTGTPTQNLSVAGNIRLTGALFDSNNASGTLGMLLQSTGTGQQWVATSTLGITSASASGTPGNIQFAGTAGAFNATNLFNWDNTNNFLGIGTSTPIAALSFASSTTASGGINFGDATANLYRSAAGTIKTDGAFNINGASLTLNSFVSASSQPLFFRSNVNSGSNLITLNSSPNLTYTSGTGNQVITQSAFQPASGTGVYNNLQINPTITQIGNSSGITRGIYLNSNLTSVADYRNFETSSTLATLSTSTNISTAYNVLFNPITYSSASSSLYTLANASTLNIAGAPSGTSASTTISSSTALTIQGVALSSVTNGYGLYVSAPTGATNNYAAIFNGNVGIGTSTPQATVFIQGTSDQQQLVVKANSTQSTIPFQVLTSSGNNILSVTNGGTLSGGNLSFNFGSVIANGSGVSTVFAVTGATNQSVAIQQWGRTGKGIYAVVDQIGQFGIGTTTPTALLSVTSSSTTVPTTLIIATSSQASDLLVVASSSGSSFFTINSSGAELHNSFAGNPGMVLLSNGTTSAPSWVATSTLGITSASASGTPGNIQFAGTAGAFNATNLFNWDNTALMLSIGTTSTSSAISLAQGTTAASGINFGDATTNLYRSAAGTIKSDGTLSISTVKTNLHTLTLQSDGTQGGITVGPIGSISNTSGTNNVMSFNNGSSGFIPTSGSAILNQLELGGIFNQTGTANGITRGIFLNPRLTSAFDFRNLETSSTLVFTLSTSTNISTAYNVLFNPITYTSASTSLYTLANASTLNIAGAPSGTSASTTISSSTALTIQGVALSSVTNGYGLYVSAPTGATNNYAAIFNGNVGINTSSPSGIFTVASSTSSTVPSLFTVSANGSVGVGAGNPSSTYKLDVNGQSRFIGNSNAIIIANTSSVTQGYVTLAAGAYSGVGIRSDANSGGSAFLVGSGNLGVLVNSLGNVGIGTTTPRYELVVASSSTTQPTTLIIATSSQTSDLLTVASSSGLSYLTIAANGSTTLLSLGTGVVRSSSGNLFNGALALGSSDVTGILGVTNGGIGTTTLGNLTVGGSNLSISGGQQVLIGTSTQITLSDTPSFTTLTVTGTTTLSSATTTINGVTYYWPSSLPVSNKILQTDSGGNLTWVPDQTGAGGSLSGGTAGFVTVWTGTTSVSSGILMDNGSVAGVNATSSSYTFNIKGSSAIDPFNISSSTGTSLFVVKQNGNVGIGTSSPYSLFQIALDASSTANSALYAASTSNGAILQLGQKNLTSPSTAGTYIGVNSPASFNGNYLQFQKNGTSFFRVANDGSVLLQASAAGVTTPQVSGNGSGNTLVLSVNMLSSASTGVSIVSQSNNLVPVSGTQRLFTLGQSNGTDTIFQPASGNATFNLSEFIAQINQTGTASGTTRSIYINPFALSSAYDYRSLEIAAKDLTISNAANPISTAYNVLLNPITYGTGSSSVYTVASSSTFSISGAPIASSTRNIILTNSYGAYIQGGTLNASTTNGIGLAVVAPTGATNNYAAIFSGGNVGIGTSTPSSPLEVNGTITINTSSGVRMIRGQTSGVTNWFIDDNNGNSTGRLQLNNGPSQFVFLTAATGGSSFINNGGNFGIGTTTPVQALSVVGNMRLTGALFDSNNASGTLGMVLQSTGLGQQWVATSTLGFGSSLSGGNTGFSAIWTSATTIGNGKFIDDGTVTGINATSSSISFNLQGSGVLDPFNIASSSGASYLRVTRTGQIGINTTTTAGLLTIQPASTLQNVLNVTSSTGASLLNVSWYGGIVQNIASTTAFNIQDGSGNSVFNIDTTGGSNGGGIDITAGASQTANLMNFYSSSGSILAAISPYGGIIQNIASTTAVSIQDGSGNSVFNINSSTTIISIGTTSNSSTLTVQGKAGSSPLLTISSSTGVSLFTILANGNVGINTSSPSGIFTIASSTSSTLPSLFTVAQNGNVGIVKASPGYSLDIGVGDINIPDSRYYRINGNTILSSTGNNTNMWSGTSGFSLINNAGSATLLRVLNTGNVGIGTTTPSQLLTVAGNMQLTGALFDSNNASGTLGMVLQSTGTGQQWVATSTLGITAASASGTPGNIQFAGTAGAFNATNLFNWDNTALMLSIGTTTTSSAISLAQGTTAASGINFGDATANLYRSAAGTIKTDGSFNINGASVSNTGMTAASTVQLRLNGWVSTAQAEILFGNNLNHQTYSSGNGQFIQVGSATSGFAPTSGTGTWEIIRLAAQVNQTGSANGITRGIFLNPTLTSAFDYRNLETSSTLVSTLSTSTNISTAYNVLFNPITYTSASSSLYTLANASTLNIAGAPSGTSASTTISSSTALTIQGVALSNVTNGYGLYVSAPTGATNNYAAIFNGNVGINTSSPSGIFTVASSTNPNATFITILANGNVGVGIANPTANLEVFGSTKLDNNVTVGGSQITFTGNTNSTIYNNISTSGSNLKITGAQAANSFLTFQSTGGVGTTDYINFLVGNNGGTEAMRIVSSGNIGIGTTSPSYKLVVASSSTTVPTTLILATSSQTSDLLVVASSSGSSFFTINSSGAELHNGFAGNSGMVLLSNGTTSAPSWIATSTLGIISASASGTPGNIQFAGTAGAFNATNLFNWDNTNLKLSVGTTSTSSTLTLQGLAGSSPLISVTSSTGANLFTVLANGNVGIGKASPTVALDITGALTTTGAITGGSTIAAVANITAGTSFSVGINNRSKFNSSADGLLMMSNLAGTDFSRIQFGGITSLFPALQISTSTSANGVALQVTGADGVGTANLLVNGNIGIGTTTPIALLSINASTTAGGGINFGDATANLYRSAAGNLKTDATLTIGSGVQLVAGGPAIGVQVANTGISLNGSYSTLAGAAIALFNNGNTNNPTSGTSNIVLIGNNRQGNAQDIFGPSSGSAVLNTLELVNAINQTGSATGTTRGLYVNPTLTSAYDFRGLETAAYIATTSQTSLLNNILFNQPTYATTGAATLANAQNLSISGAPIAGLNMTISSSSAFTIQGGAVNGGGAVTNAYGLYVSAPTGATNNYAAIFNGNVGIGSSSPYAALTFASSTLASGGINFGDATTNLYRSAAGTIKTDGNLIANGYIQGNNAIVNGISGLYYSSISKDGYSFGSATPLGAYPLNLFSGNAATYTDGYITLSTAGLERIRIDSYGNLGLGTTTPGYKLVVASGSTTQPTTLIIATSSQTSDLLVVASSSGSSLFTINSSGAELHNGFAGNSGMVLLSNGTTSAPTWVATSTLGIISASASGTPGNIQFAGTAGAFNATNLFNWDNSALMLSIGTTTTSSAISLAQGTTAASGINFGDATANLYRSAAGNIKTDVVLNVGNLSISTNTINLSSASGALAIKCAITNQNSSCLNFTDVNIITLTSGNISGVSMGSSFAPGSGSAIYNGLQVIDSLNQTGSASGTTRGLYVNPTLTSVYDFRGLETAAYTATTSQTSLLNNILFNQPTYATTGAATLANAQNLRIAGAPIAGPNLTISSSSAFAIQGGAVNGGGAVTNAYGLFVNAPTGATNNYAAIFNGNVGINTSSPSGIFTIASSTSSTLPSLFTVAPNGNVGIGTVNPSSKLQVNGNVLINDTLSSLGTLNLSPGAGSGQAYFFNGVDNTTVRIYDSPGSKYLSLDEDGTNGNIKTSSGALILQGTAGSVGIGTTTPAQTLSVSGNMRLTGALFDSNNASGTLGMILQSTGTGQQWVATSTLGITGSSLSGGNTGKVAIWTSATALGNGLILDNGTVAGINATSSTVTFNLQGTAGSSDILNIASSTGVSILKVTNNQRVGIGSTTPTATLVVQGTSTSPTLSVFAVASSTGAQFFTVLANGNVGIGTSTPNNKLDVNGVIDAFGSAGTEGLNVYNSSAGSNTFTANSAGTVTISNISSFSNVTNLVINKNSVTKTGDYIQITGTVSGDIFDINGVGKVGIGTSSPIAALQVTGPAINQSPANTAVDRGLYVSPNPLNAANTLLATDYRAFETSGYTLQLASTTAVSKTYTALFNQTTVNTTTVATLAGASNVYINGAPKSTSNLTISSSTALTVIGGAVSSTTNAYGLYLQAPTGATNNYAAIFSGGNVGIGSSTPSAMLSLQGTAGSNDILNIASSTGVSVLTVKPNQRVGIGSSTPTSMVVVQGTNLAGNTTTPIFTVSSSTGEQLFTVLYNNRVGINQSSPQAQGLEIGAKAGTDSTLNLSDNDIAHGMTSLEPTNVYGSLSQIFSNSGGLNIQGFVSAGFNTASAIVLDAHLANATNLSPAIVIRGSKSNGGGNVQALSNNEIVLEVGNYNGGATTKALDVLGSGAIGIGTSSPIASLQVTGPAINQSPANTSIDRGLYVYPNPLNAANTLLATDYRALEISPYTLQLASTTAISQTYSALFNQPTVNTTTVATIAGASNVYINGAPKSTSNLTISSSTALTVIGGTVSSTTNAYGLYLQAPTGATNNYAAIFNGNVGINTSSPSGIFTVASSTSSTLPSLLTLMPNGNVGIGVSNPTFGLDINGAIRSGSILSGGQITAAAGTASVPGFYIGGGGLFSPASNVVGFNNGITETMRITSIGSVGIGSTSPNSTLVVQGTSSLPTLPILTVASSSGASYLTVAANGSTTLSSLASAGCVAATSNGSLYITTCGGGSLSGGNTGFSAIWTSATTIGNGKFIDDGTVTGINATSSSISFNLQGSGTLDPFNVASSSGTSILRVTSAGDVGIGTSTPQNALTVVGNPGGDDAFIVASSTGRAMVWATSGGRLSVGSVGSNVTQITASGIIASVGGTGITVGGNFASTAGSAVTLTNNSNSISLTSGTSRMLQVGTTSDSFAPTSGNAVYNTVEVINKINQTSSASGTTRGIYINSNLTKAADYRALEVASYNYNLASGYSGSPLYGSLFNSYNIASSSSGTIPSASLITLTGAPQASSTSGIPLTITSSTALTILGNNVTASTTNSYGLWVQANSGATNNYAAIFNGNVGINTSSPSGIFTVASSTSSTLPSLLTVLANGNVGVGKSNPSATLDITGTVNLTSDITVGGSVRSNTVYGGFNSGNSLTLQASVNNPQSGYIILAPTGGNVGIGTTTPGSQLVVASSSTTQPTVLIVATSSQTTALLTVASSSGTSYLTVAANGSTTLSSLASAGCVAATSGGSLYITSCGGGSLSGGNTGFSAIWTSATTIGNGKFIDDGTVTGINATSSSISFNLQGSGTLDPFNVTSSSGASYLRVTRTGQIGINTTTTAGLLTIQPASTLQNVLNVTSSTGASLLNVSWYGGIVQNIASTTAFNIQDGSGNSVFNIDTTGGSNGGGIDITAGASQTANLMNFYSSSGSILAAISPYGGIIQNIASTTAVSIQDGSGNSVFNINSSTTIISIGTTSNSSTLTVQGKAGSSPLLTISSSTGVSLFTILANGNVGINTTTPNAALAINNNGTGNVLNVFTTAGAPLLAIDQNGGTTFTAKSTGGFSFYRDTVVNPLFQVNTSAATVAINKTAATTAYFDIQGANGGTYDLLNVASSTGTSVLRVTSAGNVGIGTTTPTQVLSVAGNIQLTGALFDGSNASGTLGMVLQTIGTSTRWVATSTLGISGSSLSGGNTGKVAIWTSTTNIGNGLISDNGSVAGINATSSTVTFNLQGTAGSSDILNIASSTGVSILTVKPNQRIGIGSSTPSAMFVVQGTNLANNTTTPIFTVASSSGAINLTVLANGTTLLGSSTMVSSFVAGQTLLGAVANVNQYAEINIQNFNTGANAQSGFAATANNGTATTNFAWMGINNSAFNNPQTYNVGGAGDVNFLGLGNDMFIANGTANKNMYFLTGGTTTSTKTRLTITGSGNIGIGTSGPISALSIEGSTTATGGNAIAGIYASTTLAMTTNSGFEFGNRFISRIGGSATGTYDAMFIRAIDNNTATNTVRGLEVQAFSGTNTLGINTGIASFGHTFGVQGITDGLAGGVAQPAGVFAELDHPTNGNAFRAYSNTSTTATLVSIYQETSAYTGDALLMDIGNGGTGSFNSGNFINLKKAGAQEFYVNSAGNLFATLRASTGNSALCHETNGAGLDEIKDCGGAAPAADYQEMYPTATGTEAGDLLAVSNDFATTTKGDTVSVLTKVSGGYSNNILGIASDPADSGDFNSIGYNIATSSNPFPVALKGRVKVKVTDENGPVVAGDYLTSSALYPGFAMKATRSGNVIGKALENFAGNASTTVTQGKVMTFVETGWQNVNNIFVLGENDGQLLTATSTLNPVPSSLASAFLINQLGSGNLLQLQQDGQNRLLIANNGSFSLFASSTLSTSTVLSVQNGTTSLFTINARGDAAVTGALIVKDDTFAGSVATDINGEAVITFSYPLGTGKPVVQLTPEADVPVFAQVISWATDTDAQYIGFTIKTFGINGTSTSAVVHYLVVGKEDGYKTQGAALQVTTEPMTNIMGPNGWMLVPVSSLSNTTTSGDTGTVSGTSTPATITPAPDASSSPVSTASSSDPLIP